MNRADVSVTMLVRDGEADLRALHPFLATLASVTIGDDGSNDNTVALCAREGWTCVDVSHLATFALKRDYVISRSPKGWLLWLDCDERPQDDFLAQLQSLESDPRLVAGYEVRLRLFFAGRPLSYGGTTYRATRLFHSSAYRGFVGQIHERLILEGRVAHSKLQLDHYSYASTHHYVTKINRYTDDEAAELREKAEVVLFPPVRRWCAAVGRATYLLAWKRNRSHARVYAKQTLKNRHVVVILVPLYPVARFFSVYLFRLGILDGWEGLKFAILSAMYSILKYVKFFERRNRVSEDIVGDD